MPKNKKKPPTPSLKPAALGSKEKRWGTKHMTAKEKTEFGNMVLDHNRAQKKKPTTAKKKK